MTEEKIAKLSLEEKALLTCGDGAWHTHSVGDIPSVMMTDGPHGLRKQDDTAKSINDSVRATCFPTACAVASSWNVANAREVAQCIAEEAVAENVSIVLGPGVNIKRSPLCGRNFEYFSEDPLLAGSMAAAYVSSVQQNGVGCCLKHFAVNSQETRRMTVDAIVDERALREIYLAAFEQVVKQSSPYAVMASYNKVNGLSATQNKKLLTEILRKEWGFDGVVMSDWGASYDTPKAIEAGMDLEMPEDASGYHRKTVVDAVLSGELDESCLDEACKRVLKLVDKCNHSKNCESDFVRHHDVCVRVATDSAVLLKNDGLLPLAEAEDFCVVGSLAEAPRYQGAGSSHINAQCKSFLRVLLENGKQVNYCKGYGLQQDKVSKKWEKEAISLAGQHKVVLFFGGLTDIFEGEGYDRKTLEIPANQQHLLQEIYKVNQNIVFVAFGGSPFVMPWLDKVGSLLNMYLGGQGVMEAAHNLLFGRATPSGRLAETFPQKLEDTPCYNYFAADRFFDEHRESIFVGYRYYNTFRVPALFPFGYGLSYAQFQYTDLSVTESENGFDVSVCVTNTSNTNASEVVQLYVDNPQGNFMRAKRELRGFSKVYLEAGQSERVKFVLSDRDFAVYKAGVGFVAVNGSYGISICKNVEETLLTQQVAVDFGVDIDQNDRENYPDYFTKPQGTFAVSDVQFFDLTGWYKPKMTLPKRGQFTLLNTLEDMIPKVGLFKLVMWGIKREAIRRCPTKSINDPVAKMTLYGALETPLISLMSVGGIEAKFVMFLLHHANRRYFKALRTLFRNKKKMYYIESYRSETK